MVPLSETLTKRIKHVRWRKSLTLALTNLLEGWTRGPQGQQPLLERFLLRAHQSWPILRGQPFWLHLFQESTWRNSDQTPNRRPTESFCLQLNHWPAACILTIGRNHTKKKPLFSRRWSFEKYSNKNFRVSRLKLNVDSGLARLESSFQRADLMTVSCFFDEWSWWIYRD